MSQAQSDFPYFIVWEDILANFAVHLDMHMEASEKNKKETDK